MALLSINIVSLFLFCHPLRFFDFYFVNLFQRRFLSFAGFIPKYLITFVMTSGIFLLHVLCVFFFLLDTLTKDRNLGTINKEVLRVADQQQNRA